MIKVKRVQSWRGKKGKGIRVESWGNVEERKEKKAEWRRIDNWKEVIKMWMEESSVEKVIGKKGGKKDDNYMNVNRRMEESSVEKWKLYNRKETG